MASSSDANHLDASSNPLAPKPTHFPARAKRVIYLFMAGGPSAGYVRTQTDVEPAQWPTDPAKLFGGETVCVHG